MLKEDTLENYKKSHEIEWANELPEGCPPENILIPSDQEMYRLTLEADKVTEADFIPYLEKYKERKYSAPLKIMAAGLSLFSSYDPALTQKIPTLKKFKGVAKLLLNPQDGVLAKTGGENHYTWWRSTSFDINSAEIIKKDEDA